MTSLVTKSPSRQVLITDGDPQCQEKDTKDNLPHVGLNVPGFMGENISHPGESTPGLSPSKTLENGNYLQRSFSLETDRSNSPRIIPRSERISCSSTATPNTLFPGFQIPTETIIPSELESVAGSGKKKKGITAQEAIPVLPRSAAILCLILNILFPGLGTAISGMIAFFLTRREMSLMNRTSILCINCFVGLLQLSTIVFLLIGWIWSIVWGCAFVGLSESYGKQVEKVEGGELVAWPSLGRLRDLYRTVLCTIQGTKLCASWRPDGNLQQVHFITSISGGKRWTRTSNILLLSTDSINMLTWKVLNKCFLTLVPRQVQKVGICNKSSPQLRFRKVKAMVKRFLLRKSTFSKEVTLYC